MSYHVTHRTAGDSRLAIERFETLLDELEHADDEHPDISVTHETEWSLSVFGSGFVVFENLEDGHHPRHAGPLDRAAVLRLTVAVAEGRIADVESESWSPGRPPRGGV